MGRVGKVKLFFVICDSYFYKVTRNTELASTKLLLWDLPGGSDSKVSAYNAGDLGLIPGLERSPVSVDYVAFICPSFYYI